MTLIPETRYTRAIHIAINTKGWAAIVLDSTPAMAGLNATIYGNWKRFENGARVMFYCWNAGRYTHWKA
jgi:hypothetical protein